MVHSDELLVTEQLGLTENQVDNLVKETFGFESLARSKAFLKGKTMAIRFDGQKIVYFRDITGLINHLMFGTK